MTGKGILLTAAGEVSEFNLSDKDFNATIYRQIGCRVYEHVNPNRLSKPYCMLVDESGLLKKSPRLNELASLIYESDKHGSLIVGNVVFCKEGFNEGGEYDLLPLDEQDVQEIHRILRSIKPV